jgi:hypothetical protein
MVKACSPADRSEAINEAAFLVNALYFVAFARNLSFQREKPEGDAGSHKVTGDCTPRAC